MLKVILFPFFINLTLLSQTDSLSKSNWATSGMLGININQISLTNWSQGGDNALAWTIVSNMSADYVSGSWTLKNSLKLAYGRTKLGDTEYRTNDNEIYQESIISHSVGWPVDPFFSNSIRSSVGNGFDYKAVPVAQVAAFFDPGYITQSLGLTYNKISFFSTRIGLALQETFTGKYRQYTDDPTTSDKIEAFKLDTGVECVTEGNIPVEDNLIITSKLRLFSRFNSMDVWDVRWDNTVTAQVTKFINVNMNVLLIYEKSQSVKTQLKESLQLGFTFNLF
ncbi:MAG: DUF3078 domain-containing protein [Ignavibacteriaceae bacterium]